MTCDRMHLAAIPVHALAVAGPLRADRFRGWLTDSGDWNRGLFSDPEALALHNDARLNTFLTCSTLIARNFEVLTERALQTDRQTKRTQQLERELREAREQIWALLRTQSELYRLQAEVDELRDFVLSWRSGLGEPDVVSSGVAAERTRVANDVKLRHEAVSQLKERLPAIAATFSETFGGVQPSVWLAEASDIESGFVAKVMVDATGGDPGTIAAARAAGARLDFYGMLAEVLEGDLLDVTEVEFLFPST